MNLADTLTVESELQRRLLEAENAYTRHTNQATVNKLQQVIEAEKPARRAFAEQALLLVKMSIDLCALLDSRQQLQKELLDASRTDSAIRLPENGSTWLPSFSSGWLGTEQGLRNMEQVVSELSE